VAAGLYIALVGVGFLPVSAELSTHGTEPVAGLSDGSSPAIALHIGSGLGIADWVVTTASDALPPPSDAQPIAGAASARLWVLPTVPPVTVPTTVSDFNPSMTPQIAATIGHDAVLDLIIEAEARRSHDLKLAEEGAVADGLTIFTGYTNQDVRAGRFVTSTYTFSRASLNLFLPKFSFQAPLLLGLTLTGTVTMITKDQSGHVLSQTSGPYSRSWSLGGVAPDGRLLIDQDYSDLALAG
jgi:hypothetical protein